MAPQAQADPLDQVTGLLAEHGFDGLAQALTVVLNEVMKIERSHALGAGPYQRPEGRTGHAGLKEALKARLTGVPWRRCRSHPVEGARAFVPRPSMRKAVVASLRAVFDAPDRPEAERRRGIAVRKYRSSAPKLAEWLEADVPEGLAAFALPPSHRRRPRTIDTLERLDKELRRRTRVAGLFPNEASALRPVSAVATEIGEEWETNRKYLTMEPDGPAAGGEPGIYRNELAPPRERSTGGNWRSSRIQPTACLG
jgi:hypothetical protein